MLDKIVNKQSAYEQLLDGLYEGNSAKVDEALKRGAQAGDRTLSGYSMLMRAAGTGHVYIVKRILNRGGKVNDKDEKGNTALSVAASNGFTDIIEFLLKNGAKIDAVDKEGNTALMQAIYSPEAIRTLLKYNAKIDLQNNRGETALRIAAEYGKLDSVKILLENGANPEIMDKRGCNAAKWANEEKGKIISEYAEKFKIRRKGIVAIERKDAVDEIVEGLNGDLEKGKG